MKNNYILLLSATIILGFIAVSQLRIKGKIQEIIDPRKSAVIAQEVGELIKDNRGLLTELKELQEQKDKLTDGSSVTTEESLSQDLTKYKIIAGDAKVEGPGVELKFEKPLQTVQLVDLVNALRNIGAEAISINEKRIGQESGLHENNFTAPYIVNAIGEKHILENGLTRRGGIIEQIDGSGKVIKKDNLSINAK